MTIRIGIRHEDKYKWEGRVPLVPADVKSIHENHDIRFVVEPSPQRVFTENEYRDAGAEIDPNLSGCSIIFGIKEIPVSFFKENLAYIFFSHVIKGQSYNMPMLRQMMKLGCTLFDYEKIEDDNRRRMVFFGREAGLAGMIDTLWSQGLKLREEGIITPLLNIKQAREYKSLVDAEDAIRETGKIIASEGVHAELHPLVYGFAGYGNVSNGAQHILDLFPVREISPDELLNPSESTFSSSKHVYKVVFYEKDMVVPLDETGKFELQDYYDHPEKYRGIFGLYLPHLSVLVNCIFWTQKYPRLLTRENVREMYSGGRKPKLNVIGDISCDVEGAVEITVKDTYPDNPIFIYDVDSGKAVDGYRGNGPLVMAVTILPSELPRESSIRFSSTLLPLIPELAKADLSIPFAKLNLFPPWKRALIAYQGKLTPDFEYIAKYL